MLGKKHPSHIALETESHISSINGALPYLEPFVSPGWMRGALASIECTPGFVPGGSDAAKCPKQYSNRLERK